VTAAKVAKCRSVHALHANTEPRHPRLDRSARIATLISPRVALKSHLCTVCKAKPIPHARDQPSERLLWKERRCAATEIKTFERRASAVTCTQRAAECSKCFVVRGGTQINLALHCAQISTHP
jgi:hypothetical protein